MPNACTHELLVYSMVPDSQESHSCEGLMNLRCQFLHLIRIICHPPYIQNRDRRFCHIVGIYSWPEQISVKFRRGNHAQRKHKRQFRVSGQGTVSGLFLVRYEIETETKNKNNQSGIRFYLLLCFAPLFLSCKVQFFLSRVLFKIRSLHEYTSRILASQYSLASMGGYLFVLCRHSTMVPRSGAAKYAMESLSLDFAISFPTRTRCFCEEKQQHVFRISSRTTAQMEKANNN